MIKAMKEIKLTVTKRRILQELALYWNFMCIYKNNDRAKTNLRPPLFHSNCSFLNGWKTSKSMTLKFPVFWFVSMNCFVRN